MKFYYLKLSLLILSTFFVSLTVLKANGDCYETTDVANAPNYNDVKICEENFEFSISNLPLSIQIPNQPESYYTACWDFGDGTYAKGISFLHNYSLEQYNGNSYPSALLTAHYSNSKAPDDPLMVISGQGFEGGNSSSSSFEFDRVSGGEFIFLDRFREPVPGDGFFLFLTHQMFEGDERTMDGITICFNDESSDIMVDVSESDSAFATSEFDFWHWEYKGEEVSFVPQPQALNLEDQLRYSTYIDIELSHLSYQVIGQRESAVFLRFKTSGLLNSGDNVSFKAIPYINSNQGREYLNDKGKRLDLIVKKSHDPNEMAVDRDVLYYDSTLNSSCEPLIFTVNFENVGSSETNNIVLKTAVDSDLGIRGFEILDWFPKVDVCTEANKTKSTICNNSAKYFDWELKCDESLINFYFSGIHLRGTNQTDMDTMYPTEGWVKFRLKTIPNVNTTNTITLHTDIFFDDNDVIPTDPVKIVFSPAITGGEGSGVIDGEIGGLISNNDPNSCLGEICSDKIRNPQLPFEDYETVAIFAGIILFGLILGLIVRSKNKSR